MEPSEAVVGARAWTTTGRSGLEVSATHPCGDRRNHALYLAGHRWTFTQAVTDAVPEAWIVHVRDPTGDALGFDREGGGRRAVAGGCSGRGVGCGTGFPTDGGVGVADGPDARIMPVLAVRRGAEAVAFYRRAFGARVLMEVASPDGDVVAELEIGGARLMVADESPAQGNPSPETLGGSSVRIALVVADPDMVTARAVAAGATLVYAVADQDYGWRLGRVADPYGHHWEIGRPL